MDGSLGVTTFKKYLNNDENIKLLVNLIIIASCIDNVVIKWRELLTLIYHAFILIEKSPAFSNEVG